MPKGNLSLLSVCLRKTMIPPSFYAGLRVDLSADIDPGGKGVVETTILIFAIAVNSFNVGED
jgi:hypothetical protein